MSRMVNVEVEVPDEAGAVLGLAVVWMRKGGIPAGDGQVRAQLEGSFRVLRNDVPGLAEGVRRAMLLVLS